MADDALAYLVEAFGQYTEAEIEAFLAATPSGVPDAHPKVPAEIAADLSLRDAPMAPQIVWA